ncbi:hypothetical protein PG991_009473 [Apiospora marii]|uniref:F-box domain-containing protein n=1 Tax=Apiospora marii TaxID=335849 RepID=A0ABR1RIW6_9PEZI
MSLAYYMKGGSLPHLCRVPVPADESNAHDIDRASYSHQVIASAGWHEGAWVTGWQARECDESIPLKSMLTYLSGIPRKRVVEQLPGGKTLLRISQTEGRLDRATMRKLLSEHFAQLHTIATNLADDLGITIKVVAVTFPNYLCSEETDDFIDRYMGTLLDILVPIWGRRFLYQEISEGQATALYVVEQCDDVYSANPRKKRLGELFRGLDTSQQVNLIVADSGGSTTSLPIELLHHVAWYCSPRDVFALTGTCRSLRNACDNSTIFKRGFIDNIPPVSSRSIADKDALVARISKKLENMGDASEQGQADQQRLIWKCLSMAGSRLERIGDELRKPVSNVSTDLAAHSQTVTPTFQRVLLMFTLPGLPDVSEPVSHLGPDHNSNTIESLEKYLDILSMSIVWGCKFTHASPNAEN